jgi:hypothetical protein
MTGEPLILDADGLDALTEQPPPTACGRYWPRLGSARATCWSRRWCALSAAGAPDVPVLSNHRWRGIARPVPDGLRSAWSQRTPISLAALGRSFMVSARIRRTSLMPIRSLWRLCMDAR